MGNPPSTPPTPSIPFPPTCTPPTPYPHRQSPLLLWPPSTSNRKLSFPRSVPFVSAISPTLREEIFVVHLSTRSRLLGGHAPYLTTDLPALLFPAPKRSTLIECYFDEHFMFIQPHRMLRIQPELKQVLIPQHFVPHALTTKGHPAFIAWQFMRTQPQLEQVLIEDPL